MIHSAAAGEIRSHLLDLLTNSVSVSIAIVSFRCKQTERLFLGEPVKKWNGPVRRSAQIKLELLHAAVQLTDLRVPPGNRLEALRGDRAGQPSIRANQQWRLCFRWVNGNAHDAEIVDYY